jgi:hypothetical protein
MNFTMATLTEVSEIARKSIKYGSLGLVVIALIPVAIRFGKQLYNMINPPPPPPPTVRYGRLPALEFPSIDSTATPEYKLETISGGLPKTPPSVKVYVVKINESRLLTLDRIKQAISIIGFTNEPQQVDGERYKFFHPKNSAELLINVVSGGYAYRYDWTQDKQLKTLRNAPAGNTAISQAKEYFQLLGLLPEDLANGSGKFQYLIATGSALVPTDVVYEANFTRVDLFRADKDKMRVVTAGGDTAPVNVTYSGDLNDRKVVLFNYQYSEIIDNLFETYPLKPVEQAWQELIAGNAYIAKKTISKVTIRNVSLAYYEANDPQQFLQPVYLFEGDAGFMAYVSAVNPSYQQAR